MKKIQIVFFVALFAVLFASTRSSCQIERTSRKAVRAAGTPAAGAPAQLARKPTAEELAWARYWTAIDDAGKAHLARVEKLCRDFLLGLPEKGPARFPGPRDAIPPGCRMKVIRRASFVLPMNLGDLSETFLFKERKKEYII